jgi:hypothetical protein
VEKNAKGLELHEWQCWAHESAAVRSTDRILPALKAASVASTACSCWSGQLAAVYHDGRHRCACASTETRVALSNLSKFDISQTEVGCRDRRG